MSSRNQYCPAEGFSFLLPYSQYYKKRRIRIPGRTLHLIQLYSSDYKPSDERAQSWVYFFKYANNAVESLSDIGTASGDRNSASLPGSFPACRAYSSVPDTFCRWTCSRRTCNGPAAGHNNRPETDTASIAPFRHDDAGNKAQSLGERCVFLRLCGFGPLAII